ncbi:ER membrane glycoprotein subunit of the GPI transamidase complex-like protein [Maublancomyces gigas]|uniref:GPI mannosyltransferase 2 n=1 Tax=Discina gigas TaxID=1032678 RepID=A0ABR3GYH5_9PEZI
MKHLPPQPRHRYLRILLLFSSWKFILLSLALLTPSPSYDTSTSLILKASQLGSGWAPVERLCEKLTRWDAIYFVKAAERGYINEQEWAFGWGFVQVVSGLARALSFVGADFGLEAPELHALSGILIANISHLLSTLVLYETTLLVFKTPVEKAANMAFLTACLHIISPAGLFLSAPYSESLFSLLSFTGSFLYIWSGQKLAGGSVFQSNTATLASAVIFSASCMVRSNGLLNGIIFLYDFVLETTAAVVGSNREPKNIFPRLLRIGVLGTGGLIIGLGMVPPQVIAWNDFCTGGNNRPWCSRTIPSIYFWVQDYYWNVGLFRYWTLPNIPLFLLAAPILVVMIVSGLWGAGVGSTVGIQAASFERDIIRKLAFPQIVLALLAITSYHVQIITRLSSGYMVWYWWVACQMPAGGRVEERKEGADWPKRVVRYMVVYGVVQGVLFAGFLPPA